MIYDLPSMSSCDDPALRNLNDFGEVIAHSVFPGNYFVDFFPWMDYFPASIASWKRRAQEDFHKYSKVFQGMFSEVEDRIVR